jgi:transcriptional regulator with XRE-family HTH domain
MTDLNNAEERYAEALVRLQRFKAELLAAQGHEAPDASNRLQRLQVRAVEAEAEMETARRALEEARNIEDLRIEDRLSQAVASLKKKYAAIIRRGREQKGLSQDELGKALGVSRQAVSMWESGTNLPDMARLVVMADLLGERSLSTFEKSSFFEDTDAQPDEFIKDVITYMTIPVDGSKDRFKLDTKNQRYGATPFGLLFEGSATGCLLTCHTTMMPWRFPTDPVYFASRPSRIGDHIVIQFHDDTEHANAPSDAEIAQDTYALKRLVAVDHDTFTVKQYFPELETVINAREVAWVYRVLEREELYGPFLWIKSGKMVR